MEYQLSFQLSDEAWSGSGDEGPSGFRHPSRLTLQISGFDLDGNPLAVTVPVASGEPLLLKRGQTYRFIFDAPAFASVSSISVEADQAALDGLAFNSIAIQSTAGLTGEINLPVDVELGAVRPQASADFTPVAPTLSGVQVELYDGTGFETLRSSRLESSVHLNDAYARRYNRGDADTFSARINGEIQATAEGLNQWSIYADDGVRVWVADRLLVDRWKDQAGSWLNFSLDGLVQGEWYPLQIEYYENRGSAALRLAMANADRDPLPADQLRLPPQSLTQDIQGIYGLLTVDRAGHYRYQPDAMHPALRALKGGQILEENFELQFVDRFGEQQTHTLTIDLDGEAHVPLLAIDFRHDGFTRQQAGGDSQTFYASGMPLRIENPASTLLRPLDILGGDNDRLISDYGTIWFHVLGADGSRLPDSTSKLNPELPTYFLVHGFLAGVGDAWSSPLKNGFIDRYGDWKLHPDDAKSWQSQYEPNHGLALILQDALRSEDGHVMANVVMVDWGNFSGTGADYLKTASSHVPVVGEAIANYIYQYQLDPATITLIGHSLGAHVSGFAGQAIQSMASEGLFPEGTKLERIIGMDAAGPLFNSRGPSQRLSPNDATSVFNLHTSDSFGFAAPLATYDVYINSDYAIRSPFEYKSLETLAALGWPAFYGAIAANALFDPSDVEYNYNFDGSFAQVLVDKISGIDSHSYAVAFLAALIHEDIRLSGVGIPETPVPYRTYDQPGLDLRFYDHYWGETFRSELQRLQAANDALLAVGRQPFSYASLINAAGDGGIFNDIDLPVWVPGLQAGEAMDWSLDASDGYGFLRPDQLENSGNVPFSDYMLFWQNGLGPVDVDLSSYNWFYSPDFQSTYLNGWTAYGPAPTIEYGLLQFGQALSDLATAVESQVDVVRATFDSLAAAVDQAASKAKEAIRSGWRLIFGGPVINGQVFFDERTYASDASLTSNTDLRIQSDELRSRTDSVGRYTLPGFDVPALYGNRDAVLDYRDGLVVAGDFNPDGSVTLIDSISGANMGFPLVGLPGGNITLLTTLKYAALLRWRPEWDQALIPVTPDFITSHYATLFPNTPSSFADDSYSLYASLSSDDPNEISEAIDSLEFAYSNLAVVKVVMELLRSFGLDYNNQLAWGSGAALDPQGADRIEITAFSAYGFALGQRFGQNLSTEDGSLYNPFDKVGRAAVAPQFDLDNRSGQRLSHLRTLIKEILAVYPTERLLEDAPQEIVNAFKDERSRPESELVDSFIEASMGGFLDRLSFGLDAILEAVHTRIRTAESLDRKFLIPGIAGPKRLLLEALAPSLVQQAGEADSMEEFLPVFLSAFYTPETIDRADRDYPFSISISVDPQQRLSSRNWLPGDGSQIQLHVALHAQDGSAQPAPDYGLSVRFRLGGSLQEGRDFRLVDQLADRTLYVPGGESSALFSVQLAPNLINSGDSLSVELLSADSGYGVDPLNAVATYVFGSDLSSLPSGRRDQFVPFASVDPSKAAVLTVTSSNHPSHHAHSSSMILRADPDVPNVVLRGRTGAPDAFLLGRPSLGLPHIENFHPADGDVILIDPSDFTDADRDPLITDFNTYTGLVFDLAQATPLALISDYSVDAGDRPWAGLSSSAGYYRFASRDELLSSQMPDPDPAQTDQLSPSKPELSPRDEDSTDSSNVLRGEDLPATLKPIGQSQFVGLRSKGDLPVGSGEVGLGSPRRDVLTAKPNPAEVDQPILLVGASGNDSYRVARGGWTIVADLAGGRRDRLTGLSKRLNNWSWRRLGRDGDIVLQGEAGGVNTWIVLFDPLGRRSESNRIERVELGERRFGFHSFLGSINRRSDVSFRRLNEKSSGSLGSTFGLSRLGDRDSMEAILLANLDQLSTL